MDPDNDLSFEKWLPSENEGNRHGETPHQGGDEENKPSVPKPSPKPTQYLFALKDDRSAQASLRGNPFAMLAFALNSLIPALSFLSPTSSWF